MYICLLSYSVVSIKEVKVSKIATKNINNIFGFLILEKIATDVTISAL